jgi:DNA modification methylase
MRERPEHRRATTTSEFGVSRRENHDSSAFYERFTPPVLSSDATVATRRDIDEIFCGDARHMDKVDDASVALVVTSPPYFAGKAYETDLSAGHIPATYAEYLDMLEQVFAECVRTLEPGGRIAVNVANLGRRPYRSLAADVTWILQDRLRLLLRGEIVWVKAKGATGSCAWGSFQSPANPVIVASKGRFDRALSSRDRAKRALPSQPSISRDEFLEATTDVWEIASESASRVGHPAPFPVDLPERLLHLYTYAGDLVLDPFMGSGTTAVAAVRTGRHYVGYDTEQSYVDAARDRVRAEAAQCVAGGGRSARDVARQLVEDAGFTDVTSGVKVGGGVDVELTGVDGHGRRWLFDVAGGFTTNRPGLRRSDVLWKVLGKAAVVAELRPDARFVVLTTGLPAPRTPPEAALRAVWGPGKAVHDVIVLDEPADAERLGAAARRPD